MQESDDNATALTPAESWHAVHATMDRARSSMYTAGTTAILLLWGVIAALGYLSQYLIHTLAPEFTARYPWLPLPLWGGVVMVGMLGSAIIGHRAGSKNATGDAARSAGVRVFLYWLAVVIAAIVIPAAAGMWTADAAANIPRVSMGIVALGYILFGIMHRPVIAAVGAGIAAAFYVPSYVAGDLAPVVTAIGFLIVVALSAAWIRKSGVL